MVAILGYSRPQILAAVRQMYGAVAAAPDSPFHFPVGAEACRRLGYPPEQTDALPAETLACFAGVGYPFRAGAIRRSRHRGGHAPRRGSALMAMALATSVGPAPHLEADPASRPDGPRSPRPGTAELLWHPGACRPAASAGARAGSRRETLGRHNRAVRSAQPGGAGRGPETSGRPPASYAGIVGRWPGVLRPFRRLSRPGGAVRFHTTGDGSGT